MNVTTLSETDAANAGDAHKPFCEDGAVAENLDIPQPVVKAREEHSISRRDIDPDALKVLYRLARNKYTAYLVGGGVRDLLLGRAPKDFDISTDAKPEQIRSLFRNCILIGRRFRLAHIRYGEKIIETSTFRSTPKQQADPADPDADLFQRDDNLFGSPAEDAIRRDFTVNGLFYDIESFSIIDYVGGMEDLDARRIRCIGDPCIRFREDPVRMIRAVRFASRLDFSLDPGTEAAIHQYGPELTKASPARLLEEITRLFAFSVGEKAVRLLRSTGLLNVILPEVDVCLDSDKVNHDLFWKRLRALDCGDTVLPDATPALIFAVLLLDSLKMYLGKSWDFETTPRLRFDKLYAFMQPLAQRLRFPKKLVDRIIHMYLNQNRFCGTSALRGKPGSLANFVTQEAFHESLALAEIILAAEGGDPTCLNHWREMLQERIYGREEGVRNGNGNNGHCNGGHGWVVHAGSAGAGKSVDTRVAANRNSVECEIVAAVLSGSDGGDEQGLGEDGESAVAHRLSRSARRRRNKRLRRMQQPERVPGVEVSCEATDGASGLDGELGESVPSPSSSPSSVPSEATPVVCITEGKAGVAKSNNNGRSRNGRRVRKAAMKMESGVVSEGVDAPVADAAVLKEPSKAVSSVGKKSVALEKDAGKKSAASVKRGRREGSGGVRKRAAAVDEGGVGAGSVGEGADKDVAPPKPLTAAAFWKEPEPEVEVEKKKRGRGGRSGAGSRGKAKAASAAKDEDKESSSESNKPLAMDKADEADIPMHWLDEI